MLQAAASSTSLTVAEMVRHFAGFYPRRRPGRGDRAGRPGRKARAGRKLSGGQRRRLDVALGIIGRPDLLFLDEPTTGFDPEARRQFWALIRNLTGEGTTIVLTTHYLDEAEALTDRVGVITAGRMVEVARRPARHREGAGDGPLEDRTEPCSGADATPTQCGRAGRPLRRRGARADRDPAVPGRRLPGLIGQ